MDEYSVRYGDVLKENSFKVDNNIRTKPSTPQLFYGEPRKKVKESVTQVKEKCNLKGIKIKLLKLSELHS